MARGLTVAIEIWTDDRPYWAPVGHNDEIDGQILRAYIADSGIVKFRRTLREAE